LPKQQCAADFARMLLRDMDNIKDVDAEDIVPPTKLQIQFVDSLGLKMSEYKDCSKSDISNLISAQTTWKSNFQASHKNLPPATSRDIQSQYIIIQCSILNI
jgi:hypothetical protein